MNTETMRYSNCGKDGNSQLRWRPFFIKFEEIMNSTIAKNIGRNNFKPISFDIHKYFVFWKELKRKKLYSLTKKCLL